MFVRFVLLLGALAGCSANPPGMTLDPLFAFEDPLRCEKSPQFAALLDSALVFDELPAPDAANEIFRGRLGQLDTPEAYRGRFGDPALTVDRSTYTAEIPVGGTWHGARLDRLVVVQTVESEGGFYLVFDEPKQRVVEAANRAGFALPENGTVYRDTEIMGLAIDVGDYDGKTALSCFDM